MKTPWRDEQAGSTEIEQVVYLSNLIGADLSLVQPGGGNTSVKVEEEDLFNCRVGALVVKGSGTDLRTIGASGFTHLYMERLAMLFGRAEGKGERRSPLREGQAEVEGERRSPLRDVSDEGMMRVMRACMLFADHDPVPSVETPLHLLLPYKFVAHTHDVATLSLTDTPSAQEHVERVFGKDVAFLEYVRPGFPLAKRLAERSPAGLRPARALVMEKHGLVVWGETARECYESLARVISRAEEYVAERAKGKQVLGPRTAPEISEDERRAIGVEVLPVIRGELVRLGYQCVLEFDSSDETVGAISGERFGEVASRGMMTPEHILRAGVRPLLVALGNRRGVGAEQRAGHTVRSKDISLVAQPLRQLVENDIREYANTYAEYAAQNRRKPIADFLKTVVLPGVGIVFAGKDKRNAEVAADCYRATMRAMAGAEAVERFAFLSEADACEMEYWPLERRKIEEAAGARKPLEEKVALVIGAGSGIGRATALRFAAAGAHVAAADIEAPDDLVAEVPGGRAVALSADVTDAEAVEGAVEEAVLAFGGIDVLFYSPGVAPELQSVAEMSDAEAARQIAVHYEGAVRATREVSQVMLTQGTSGRLIYNASKAAFAPGEGAAAYGASKAALVHYARNAANELGRHGITANVINADAVDTPLFRSLVRQRAEQQGVGAEEMLARYAERSTLREALVPPEAVAEAALWLASEASAHTTGCVITVGGGAEGFPR